MRGKYEREESPAPDCINTLVNRLNCARCRPGSQPPRGGFWALFCCRSEHSDTNYAALPRAQQPSSADDQYKKVPSGLPISVVPPNTGDKSSPDGLPVQVSGHRPEAQRPTSQDNTKPAFPQPQPTPIGQHPPRQPPQGVSDLRKRYEVNGATPSPYYHPPGSRQPSAPSPKFREFIGWALSSSDQKGAQTDGAKFFAGSINLDDDDEMLEIQRLKGKQLQDVVTQLQRDVEKHERRHHYKSIFDNAQLYQIYDVMFQRKESRRLRHRFRESIRKRLAARRAQAAAGRLALEDSPNDFRVLRDMEDSEESSDEENREGRGLDTLHTSFGKGDANPLSSSIRVKPRESKDRDRVAPTAKYGEMRDVAKKFAGSGPSRAHWADMHEVVERGLVVGLSSYERNLQEARFEILTSEASYFKSLNVLVDFFYKAPVFTPGTPNAIVTAFDKHQLFSNILDIHVTSENLLHALETHFKENPMMDKICDILYEHSENKLSYYVTYVKNQMYQLETLNKIMRRPAFAEEVKRIQSMPACNGLDLNSFLVLPMQRVMRLRLLVSAVLHYTPRTSPAYVSGLVALASIETLVEKCNREKGHMEQKQRLLTLASQLEFKSSITR
uniref:DH domain-containing protein n=1 Tax=Schistocephalus solidus TaxID=70667 RepID=A0A0X3NWA1_SCHSO